MRFTPVYPLVLLCGLTVSNSLFAEGWYGGLHLGMGVVNLRTPNGTDRDEHMVLGAVAGYQVNPYWGLEAQYTGVGKASDNLSGSVKVDALSVSLVGTIPLNTSFKFFAKAGIANTDTTVSSALVGLEDARRTGATVGLGAEYAFDQTIAMRVGWDYYGARVDTPSGQKDFATNVSGVGVVVHF